MTARDVLNGVLAVDTSKKSSLDSTCCNAIHLSAEEAAEADMLVRTQRVNDDRVNRNSSLILVYCSDPTFRAWGCFRSKILFKGCVVFQLKAPYIVLQNV